MRRVAIAGGVVVFFLLLGFGMHGGRVEARVSVPNSCSRLAVDADGKEVPSRARVSKQVGIPFPPQSVLKAEDRKKAIAEYAKKKLALAAQDPTLCNTADEGKSRTACESLGDCAYGSVEAKFTPKGNVEWKPSKDPKICNPGGAESGKAHCLALDVSGECETKMLCSAKAGQSSSKQSSSAMKENRCFICYYSDHLNEDGKSVCSEAKNPTECKYPASKDNGKGDCKWVGNKCMNVFLAECREREEQKRKAKELEKAFYLPESAPLEGLNLKKCTNVELFFNGHSNEDECEEKIGYVATCIKLAKNCKNFRGIFETCLVFKDTNAANEHAKKLQQMIGPNGQVTVTGYQGPVDAKECTTSKAPLTIEVTCNETKSKFGACHQEGAFCYGDLGNFTVKCTDKQSEVVRKSCCFDDQWHAGTTCPDRVDRIVDDNHRGDGEKCEAGHLASTCEDAEKAAKESANSCVKRGQEWCDEHKGAFSAGDCVVRPPNSEYDKPPSCERVVFCPWACKGIPRGEE